MRLISALVIAFSTYSRIPMPQVEWNEENKKYSMCFFPLIGLAVGAVMLAWIWLCERLGIGSFLKGAVGAVLPLLITGGIHMDGFMDTMDAMASWQPKERRLEILKDSHIGAFAAIGCAGYLLVMAGLLSEFGIRDICMAGLCFVVSRSLSALTLTWFPKAKKTGMLSGFAHSAEKKAVTAVCAAMIIAAVGSVLVMNIWVGLLVLAAAVGCTMYYRHFTDKFFGGVTGDLAGWFVQITEMLCMLAIVIGGKF